MTSSCPSVSFCYSSRLLKGNAVVDWPSINTQAAVELEGTAEQYFPLWWAAGAVSLLIALCAGWMVFRSCSHLLLAIAGTSQHPAAVSCFLCVVCHVWSECTHRTQIVWIYMCLSVESPWWPKLSQCFSQTPVIRGAGASFTLVGKGNGK